MTTITRGAFGAEVWDQLKDVLEIVTNLPRCPVVVSFRSGSDAKRLLKDTDICRNPEQVEGNRKISVEADKSGAYANLKTIAP